MPTAPGNLASKLGYKGEGIKTELSMPGGMTSVVKIADISENIRQELPINLDPRYLYLVMQSAPPFCSPKLCNQE